ncbi:MAG: right-handed parallel beta-helix repeat-containing protein [Candidatus Eisenbacteria sp.]|nr:right-handed parallel beta-helix repeat-containing protein [Candidatus Eisenbacteria bacterium]
MWRTSVAGAVLFVLSAPAHPTTHLVRPDGTGDWPTIQAAVAAALGGDVIELADGVFAGPGNRDVDIIGKELAICSQSGDPMACQVDCQGTPNEPHRALLFWTASRPYTGSVEGITFIHGYAEFGGGVLCREHAHISFANCVFRENEAVLGGGLCCVADEGSLLGGSAGGQRDVPLYVISDCFFENNHALGTGGAAYLLTGSYLLEHCRITSNEGDGISCMYAVTDYTDCDFRDNTGPRGALVWETCFFTSTIQGCTFRGNAPAALYNNHNVDIHIESCTFWSNAVAIQDEWATPCVLARTIIANSSVAAFGEEDNATLTCCDLFGNAGGDWVGSIAEQLGINGNFSADPCFCDAKNGDYHLWNYSPCNQEGCGLIGAWPVGCSDPQVMVPVPEPRTRAPRASVSPNPVAGPAQIRYVLPTRAKQLARFTIYDPAGRAVRTLMSAGQATGALTWDATDARGHRVPSGAYFLRLRVGEQEVVRRVVVVH